MNKYVNEKTILINLSLNEKLSVELQVEDTCNSKEASQYGSPK
jgi:hypothetical protein